MTKRRLQDNVRSVVDRVVDLVHPLRIVLFGSAATGKVGRDSDLDFLVVVPDGQLEDAMADLLNTRIRPRPMPCDFLVVTHSRLKQSQEASGLVYANILKDGREVYVA
jgi:predicted nucleotidyltransferase